MKFKVEKLKKVEKEFNSLTKEQQDLLNDDYKTIEKKGIEYVWIRPLAPKLFEIKTKDLRSIFRYAENQVIIIGLIFEKDSQKTPKDNIKLAKKRLKP